jgi:glycogen debranching enzyme
LLLLKLSRETNGNGRVVHEASTNGAVYNPGNVNETPHFVSLVATYFRWTGDREILNELYPELVKGLAWLEQQDTEGNGFPNGPGMMEIHGLDSEMIDVASYTQQAYEDAAYLASTMGESDRATAFSTKAAQLRQQIQTDWWVPEARSFADFIGTPEEARRLVADALVRADTLQKPWSVAELKQTARRLAQDRSQQKRGHVVYHNWVVNTPLETGLATAEQAAQALATAQRYTNPFGMYVTGVDRTEGPDSVVLKSRKKTFSYVGAVMTLPTGVQAVAAARYGEPDEALSYLHKLANSFSYALPGSMYEVSPDFGMFTQAWNLYAVAVPVVRYFFGIAPDAGQRLIILQPNLPSSWKQATLREVPVGDNKLMFFVARETGKTNYRFAQTQADWKVRMLLPDEGEVWLDDQPLHDLPLENGRVVLELAGAHHTIEVRHR